MYHQEQLYNSVILHYMDFYFHVWPLWSLLLHEWELHAQCPSVEMKMTMRGYCQMIFLVVLYCFVYVTVSLCVASISCNVLVFFVAHNFCLRDIGIRYIFQQADSSRPF